MKFTQSSTGDFNGGVGARYVSTDEIVVPADVHEALMVAAITLDTLIDCGVEETEAWRKAMEILNN